MITVGEGRTRIPVRSLWFLLIYASDMLERLQTDAREAVLAGERDQDLADVVAEVFVADIESRLRRQLTPQYRDRAADLAHMRGRVDHLRTNSARLLDRGRIACRFPELVVDTPRNRYLAATLRKAASLVRSGPLSQRCTVAAFAFHRIGVGSEAPTRAELSRDRFGHHDRDDKHLLTLAHLLVDMAVPHQEHGHVTMPRLDTDAHEQLRILFEKAVRNYYRYRLRPQGWSVGSRRLEWDHQPTDSGADLLPQMKTDITLDHAPTRRRILIETKFTDALTDHHSKTTINRNYLFQLYSYLMSQTGSGAAKEMPAAGVLLFVKTGTRPVISREVTIQGHVIRFVSLDLDQPLAGIRRVLDACTAVSGSEENIHWPSGGLRGEQSSATAPGPA
ncbi:5-methylcytosine restriction system specificity protein McrC [Nocardia sp. NPDC003345]